MNNDTLPKCKREFTCADLDILEKYFIYVFIHTFIVKIASKLFIPPSADGRGASAPEQ